MKSTKEPSAQRCKNLDKEKVKEYPPYLKILNDERIEELAEKPFFKIFPEKLLRIKLGLCTMCGEEITGFKDKRSKDEYRISGMCQNCQDEIWG